ncbi:MAG: hypothetical protein U0869_24775 [Chloroflexota bacterium]
MPAPRRAAIACALAALAIAILVVVATLREAGGSPSALVRMDATEPMARFARAADPSFRFQAPDGHYDGVYFYAIAMDPLALGEQSAVVTQPAYRYRDPLYGWIAGAVALGQAPLLPWSLLLVNLAMLALAAGLVSLLAAALGASPWLGLLVALGPGFLVSVTVDTAEPTAMALVAAGLLLWLRDKRWAAGVALLGATFAREIGVLIALGVALVELAAWWRAREARPPFRHWLRRVSPLALAPVLYLAWWGWLRLRLGAWPTFEPSNLDWPLLATWDTLTHAARLGAKVLMEEIQLGVGMVALLGAALGATVIGAVRALRLRTIVDGPVLCAAILVLSLNWLPMLYPKEMLRDTAIFGVLLILSFAAPARRRAGEEAGAAPPSTRDAAPA